MAIIDRESTKQLARDLAEFNQICVAEIDTYNRQHDDDMTVAEALAEKDSTELLSFSSFDDFLDDKYPERVRKRARTSAKAAVLAEIMSMPLRQRLRISALSELWQLLKNHADNLVEFEAAFEDELEEEDEGSFG
jgi:hypothetical protein